ncbi:hypothetical protein MPSEU_000421800 [Mayamaea pseudoterrestris]|nr:hypothetical protein MPSEU_000421800 [Mayamaea pseudoterrestris]
MRGGGGSNDETTPIPVDSDREIDAYIDRLVSTVSDGSDMGDEQEAAYETPTVVEPSHIKDETDTDESEHEETLPEKMEEPVMEKEEESLAVTLKEIDQPVVAPESKLNDEEQAAAADIKLEPLIRKRRKRTTKKKSHQTPVVVQAPALVAAVENAEEPSPKAKPAAASDTPTIPLEPTPPEPTLIPISSAADTKLEPLIRKKKRRTKKQKQQPVVVKAPALVAAVDDAGESSSNAKPQAAAPTIPVTPNPQGSSSSAEVAVTPPNGIYRFLLRRGRIGHVMVLCMIVCLEWIHVYVPPLHRLLTLVYVKCAPNFIQNPPASVAQAEPQSRKRFAQQADALAWQQLRQIGNVATAKYKYLSKPFMLRHGLGVTQQRKSSSVRSSGEDAALISVVSQVLGSGKQQQRRVGSRQRRPAIVPVDDDVAWIMQALTMEEPGVVSSLAIYDDGMELSPVDLKRQAIQQTLLQQFQLGRQLGSSSKQSSNLALVKPRVVSDRDAGMLGRIRAGVGSNTMSRSLFGAYPGDAVPISEAASPNGVIELAKRYGYGDWSDSDDDDDNVNGNDDKGESDDDWGQLELYESDNESERQLTVKRSPSRPRRRRKTQRRQSSMPKTELRRQGLMPKIQFGLSFGGGQGLSTSINNIPLTSRAGRASTLLPPSTLRTEKREPSFLTPAEKLRKSDFTTKSETRKASPTAESRQSTSLRPPMSRISELRSMKEEKPFRSAMERLNEIKRNNDGGA